MGLGKKKEEVRDGHPVQDTALKSLTDALAATGWGIIRSEGT